MLNTQSLDESRTARVELPEGEILADTQGQVMWRPWWVIGVVAAVALLVRAVGIGHGLPDLYNAEERSLAEGALRILSTGQIRAEMPVYPSFAVYLHFISDLLTYVAGLVMGWMAPNSPLDAMDNAWRLYLGGRLFSAVLSTLTVVALYKVGQRLFGQGVGLLAAALLALAPVAVEYAHLISPDPITSLLMVLSVWFAARLMIRPRLHDYVLGGVCIGLAAATQFRGGLALVPFLVAHFLVSFRERVSPTERSRWIAWGLGACVVSWVICASLLFSPLPTFLDGVARQALSSRLGSETLGPMTAWEIVMSLGGLVPSMLVLAGAAYSIYRHTLEDWVVLIFVSIYVAAMGRSIVDGAAWLPILPFLMLLASRVVVQILPLLVDAMRRLSSSSTQYWPVVLLVVLILTLGESGYRVVLQDSSLLQPDTRVLAREWITDNIPPKNKIAREEGTPTISGYSAVAVSWALSNDHSLDWYKRQGYSVLVLAGDKAAENPFPKYDNIRLFHAELEREGTLLQEFRPTGTRSGPWIRIYQILPLIKRGDVLFAEEFEDNQASRWVVYDGNWLVERGMYRGVGETKQGNLLRNPGFEDLAKDGQPNGWVVSPWGGSEQVMVLDMGDRHGETRAAKIEKTNDPGAASYYQMVGMKGGRLHRLCGYMKGAGAQVILAFFDNMGKELPDSREYFGLKKDEWEEFSFTFTPPEETTKAQMWLAVYEKNTAWFDDLSLERATDINNLAVVNVSPEEASSWDNYAYTARVMLAKSSGSAGIAFRIQDSGNYYFVELDAGSQAIQLAKMLNGEVWKIAEVASEVEAFTLHTLRVDAVGRSIEVYLDNQLKVQVEDESFAAGKVGLWLGEGAEAFYASVRVIYEP